jgi:hypothetical protein
VGYGCKRKAFFLLTEAAVQRQLPYTFLLYAMDYFMNSSGTGLVGFKVGLHSGICSFAVGRVSYNSFWTHFSFPYLGA